MKIVHLNDDINEEAYLRRLLTREVERLEKWIANPSQYDKKVNILRLRDDLAAAQSILEKL